MRVAACLVWLLGLSLGLQRGARAQARLSLGFSAGGTWASARFPTRVGLLSQTARAGADVGVVGALAWGHLAVQPALRFTQLGDQVQGEFPYAPGSFYQERRRLNYLQLPVLGRYAFHATGQGLHLLAGPYVGLLVGGAYEEQTGSPKTRTRSVTQGGRWDAGLQVGVGYQVKGLLGQACYGWGLRQRRVPDSQEAYQGASASYNEAWHLRLTYVWGPAALK